MIFQLDNTGTAPLYEDKERSSKDGKELTLEKIDEIDTVYQELEFEGEIDTGKLVDDGDERSDYPIIDRMAQLRLKSADFSFLSLETPYSKSFLSYLRFADGAELIYV